MKSKLESLGIEDGKKEKEQKSISWTGAAKNFTGSKGLEGRCVAEVWMEKFGITIFSLGARNEPL